MRVDFKRIAEELAATAPSREELDQEASSVERLVREQRLEDSGIDGAITAEDRERVLSDALIGTHALRNVRRWMTERRNRRLARPLTTLTLVGETGRGKTLAGAWLVSRLGGVYVTAETLARASAARFGRDRENFERWLDARVLIVDDLGTERDADLAKGALWDVVNARIGSDRAWTLLTANLEVAAFRERHGERTIRRIEHYGAIVTVNGEDMRRGPVNP